jgi:hypothetical protein
MQHGYEMPVNCTDNPVVNRMYVTVKVMMALPSAAQTRTRPTHPYSDTLAGQPLPCLSSPADTPPRPSVDPDATEVPRECAPAATDSGAGLPRDPPKSFTKATSRLMHATMLFTRSVSSEETW